MTNMLKKTGVKLELLRDTDVLMMVENELQYVVWCNMSCNT